MRVEARQDEQPPPGFKWVELALAALGLVGSIGGFFAWHSATVQGIERRVQQRFAADLREATVRLDGEIKLLRTRVRDLERGK